MHIEVTDETQPLIDEGSASAAEMPAHEAVAMADDEGGRTSEVEWLTQISKHLHQDGYLGHEVVRQIENLLEAFSPPPPRRLGLVLEEEPGHRGEDPQTVD